MKKKTSNVISTNMHHDFLIFWSSFMLSDSFSLEILGQKSTEFQRCNWLRHYATRRKVVGSRPDDVN
jgi:hypothetical protein